MRVNVNLFLLFFLCVSYISNDSSYLPISPGAGEVELENVPLRKDALRHMDIPLQVMSGFVGRVKLQIPVARLRSEPWVVVFEKLYGVVSPIKLDQVGVVSSLPQ